MTEVVFHRGPNDSLVAFNEETLEFIRSTPPGYPLYGELFVARSHLRLRRFFKMLALGFDTWDPPERDWNGLPFVRSRKSFREYITILAGYFEPTWDKHGTLRIKAKSIAFANMEEAEFERLYAAIKEVLLKNVLTNYSGEDLERVVDELERF